MFEMKQLFKEFLDFYRNQLLIGFFKKRGKSLVIPHVVFAIERLLEQYAEKKTIRILDMGCGEGHLLRVIDQIGKISGFSDKLELYGFDFDRDMLEAAAETNQVNIKLIEIDLRHDTLTQYYDFFDIVVEVNTFHEVFSSYVGEDNTDYPETKIRFAKERINTLIGEVSKMLKQEGTFILYDGLAPVEIRFQIINPILEHYFEKMISEFSLWPIKCKKAKNTITMAYYDFCWFISTFKYLNTKLWPFESGQIYQYCSETDFARAFHEAGLMRESVMYISNDLGLWKNNVKLELGQNLDFPMKSILVVGSKKYIPSKYDYFSSQK